MKNESLEMTPAIRAAIQAVVERVLLDNEIVSTSEEMALNFHHKAAPLCFEVALKEIWSAEVMHEDSLSEEEMEEQRQIAGYRSLRMLHERDGEPAIITAR